MDLSKYAKEFGVEIIDNEDFGTGKKYKTINIEAKGCSLHLRFNDEENYYGLMFDFEKSSKRCKAGNHFEDLGYDRAYERAFIMFDSNECDDDEDTFKETLDYIVGMLK
jgi:hypothetical protein